MSLSMREIATKAQQGVLDSIPEKWRLSSQTQIPSNVMDIPKSCGILMPTQIEITEQTATELLGKLANGSLSSVEVTEAFLARAAIAHQLTNCLTAFFAEEALEAAKSLDAHLKSTGKTVGPLHGLPVSVKDMYDLTGHPVTLGYMSWADVISEKDSILVKALRDAGAVFYVKTTMPQTGMALETWSTLWGRTLNPRNKMLGSGGSSGGDGALIALKGSPIGPSSDIGGSIRAPAAFNGLYSIRPSAERIPKGGMRTTAPGQNSIKVSCGPCCHSMADLQMFTKVINGHPFAEYDASFIPIPWREVESPTKLTVGLLEFDGVCMPHPPILRAMRETAAKLKAAGHEVVSVKLPFDCWEVALTTWKLYFQTGAAEQKATLAKGGEPMIPSLKRHMEIFDIRELSVPELFACNTKQAGYKAQMARFWASTAESNASKAPLDAMICPVHPSAGYPHDFTCWWGYTSIFNILDYPSITLPIKTLKISAETDPKDLNYKPLDNPFDKPTYEMYDPELFSSQPVCLQIVGFPYRDEELIALSEVLDRVLNVQSNAASIILASH